MGIIPSSAKHLLCNFRQSLSPRCPFSVSIYPVKNFNFVYGPPSTTSLDLHLTGCAVLKIQDDQVLFSYLSLFQPVSPSVQGVKGRMVVTVPICLVQLPDICVGKGSTTTGEEEQAGRLRGAGAGSLQRGSGALIFALPPGLPTERTAPTRAPCRGGPRRRRPPLVRASSHRDWVTGQDDPTRGPLTQEAGTAPFPILAPLPSSHLLGLGRPGGATSATKKQPTRRRRLKEQVPSRPPFNRPEPFPAHRPAPAEAGRTGRNLGKLRAGSSEGVEGGSSSNTRAWRSRGIAGERRCHQPMTQPEPGRVPAPARSPPCDWLPWALRRFRSRSG